MSTEAVDLESKDVGSLTIVHRRTLRSGYVRTDASQGETEFSEDKVDWRLEPVPVSESAPVSVSFPTAPPCVHDFVGAAAGLPGVQCIVVEEEEGAVVHITTFAANVEEVRDQVYELEARLIDDNPNLVFDFHVRRQEEVQGDMPAVISARHYFAVCGSLDADE